jgi:hypothetical protein
MKRKIILFLFSLFLTLALGSVEQVLAQISGRIIDLKGEPIKEELIELISLESKTEANDYAVIDELTNENGEFEFEYVKQGKYVLAINYRYTPDVDAPFPTTFYPNASEISQAAVFEIDSTKTPQKVLFQLLEKLAELTVKGKIFLSNGEPAINAHVRLHNEKSNFVVSDCRTDKKGNFELRGFVGGIYHLEADNYKIVADDWDSASSDVFTLNRNKKSFRLLLKSVKERLNK